jgi:hypothetical protein
MCLKQSFELHLISLDPSLPSLTVCMCMSALNIQRHYHAFDLLFLSPFYTLFTFDCQSRFKNRVVKVKAAQTPHFHWQYHENDERNEISVSRESFLYFLEVEAFISCPYV